MLFRLSPFFLSLLFVVLWSCNQKGPSHTENSTTTNTPAAQTQQHSDKAGPTTNTEKDNSGSRQSTITLKDLRYHGKPVHITKHANCRMGCRNYSPSQVQDILNVGKVNPRKSEPSKSPCPVYALEGYTKDKQHTRAVVADCGNEARLITIIDLDNEFECHCD